MDYISSSISVALAIPELFWIMAIITGALFIRAAIGFGDGLLAVPLLSFFVPIQEAVPLVLFISSTMSIIVLWRDRQQVQLGSLGRTTVTALVGFPLGAIFLSYIDAATMKVFLGFVLIILALWQLVSRAKIRIKRNAWSYIFGFLAGVLGSALAFRGVVFAIYGNLRGWSPAQFRSTIHGFYVTSGLMIPFVYLASNLVTPRVIGLFILILSPAILATLLGVLVTGKLDSQGFQKSIWKILLFIGVALIVQKMLLVSA